VIETWLDGWIIADIGVVKWPCSFR